MNKKVTIPPEILVNKIFEIRGSKVMLDSDLADLYEVETKALKQAVKRNIDIFPAHFMFELTQKEYDSLRSQFVTSKAGRGGTRYLPMVFTEHGILQVAHVIRSKRARHMSVRITELFIKMREMLLTHKDLLLKMEEMEKKVSGQDEKISQIFNYLKQFIKEEQTPRVSVGYKRKDEK